MSVVEQVSENRLFHYYYLLSCGHVIWMRPAWCVLMQPDTSGYLRECVRKSPYIFCLFLSKLLIRFRFVSNTLGTWESIKLLFSNIPEDIVHLKTFPIRMQNEQQTWHEEKKNKRHSERNIKASPEWWFTFISALMLWWQCARVPWWSFIQFIANCTIMKRVWRKSCENVMNGRTQTTNEKSNNWDVHTKNDCWLAN